MSAYSPSADDVRKLREETGAGMLDCRKALLESAGDFEKARDHLRKKGLAAVAKRADRVASQGVIAAFLSGDARRGALVEVRCETDFVARTDEFIAASKGLAEKAAAGAADAAIVENLVSNLATKCGEKVEVGRIETLEIPSGSGGCVGAYIHTGNKVGVIVAASCGDVAKATSPEIQRFVRTIAMQAAAAKPQFLCREEVSAEAIAREKAIHQEQAAATGKPAPVVEKIVAGRLQKFFSEVCLLDQEFMITPESETAKTVSDYVAEVAKKNGTALAVQKYVRLELGG